MENALKEQEKDSWKVLSRDVIKYIAMFTMALNHIADAGLVPYAPGTRFLNLFFIGIGYFTAITMCYFLVEGYEYTRSKPKYAIRLLIFAFISQIPFSYALPFGSYNMLFTLFLCFMILVVREKVLNTALRRVLTFLLVLASFPCDWPLLAPIFTILFAGSRGNKKKMCRSYLIAYVLFVFINTLSVSQAYDFKYPAVAGALEGIPLLLSGVVILCFYNGKRAEHGRKFSQWFFYLFYPLHLLIIGLAVHGVLPLP